MWRILLESIKKGVVTSAPPEAPDEYEQLGQAVRGRTHALFGRSLHVRAIDTGSCNGCEIELTQLATPHYDMQRYGIEFVASPRHADALLVTGPVTRAREGALLATYEAMADPKLVLAAGECAISGGITAGAYGALGGVGRVLPVDVHIPGCPPRPQVLLAGLLTAMGKAEPRMRRGWLGFR